VTDHYDAVIVGTGAGGGTLANVLAQAGKRILLFERTA
jgi:choline dehydrogenase-like flavoprotein